MTNLNINYNYNKHNYCSSSKSNRNNNQYYKNLKVLLHKMLIKIANRPYLLMKNQNQTKLQKNSSH